MRKAIAMLVVAAAALSARAATCPIDQPVVKLPEQTVAGYHWSGPDLPMDDPCIGSFAVEKRDERRRYAGGPNGLYVTANGGAVWSKVLSGNVEVIMIARETENALTFVYVAIGPTLYLSRDHGRKWEKRQTFSKSIRSLAYVDGKIFVGLHWFEEKEPSGIWITDWLGRNPEFHPFEGNPQGLVVWTIAHDPKSNTFYAGTEISTHPKPYRPPFFRSVDGGKTWQNITGKLLWHVIDIAIRHDGFVYALTEGAGVWTSADRGDTWVQTVSTVTFGNTLVMHPAWQTRLYIGQFNFKSLPGGVFLFDAKKSADKPVPIGLTGVTAGDIALNRDGTRIWVALYGAGIYSAFVPF
jgi:hypothetical protein